VTDSIEPWSIWDGQLLESDTAEANVQLFEIVARDPQTWANQARMLAKSADVLWERLDQLRGARFDGLQRGVIPSDDLDEVALESSAFMLAGLALENALKARIVAGAPEQVIAGKWPWPGDGHLSPELVQAAGLELASEESTLVRFLARQVRWAGRYPLPKSFIGQRSFGYGPYEVYKGFKALLTKLMDKLPS
jgi:hypothetical protein